MILEEIGGKRNTRITHINSSNCRQLEIVNKDCDLLSSHRTECSEEVDIVQQRIAAVGVDKY